MKVQVLGTGCAKCRELTRRAERAISDLGLDVPVEKVTDLGEILKAGVMITPALLIDGEVRSTGHLPTEAEIRTLLATGGTEP